MPIHVSFLPKVLFKTIFKPRKTDYALAGPASARDATMPFDNHSTVKEVKELAKGDKDK